MVVFRRKGPIQVERSGDRLLTYDIPLPASVALALPTAPVLLLPWYTSASLEEPADTDILCAGRRGGFAELVKQTEPRWVHRMQGLVVSSTLRVHRSFWLRHRSQAERRHGE